MRLVPDVILAALIAGIGLGAWTEPSLPSAWPLLLLCLGVLGTAVGCRLFGVPAGPLLLAAALIFGVWRAEIAVDQPLPVVPTGSSISATVLVTDAPTVSGGRYRFQGRVVSDADGRAGPVPVGVGLLVYSLPPEELVAERDMPFVRYGDQLRVSGSVERPEPIGEFDYAAWLESQGIVGVMWARRVDLVATGGGSKATATLHHVRTALASAIQRAVPAPESGLAQALLMGIRTELPQDVKESFRSAGMSHLLAISGLHVGVVMALTLAAASGLAGRHNPWAILGAALVVWGYAVLSGLDPPVVRAAIMGSLYLAQGLLGRGVRGLTALLLAGAAMVLIDPSLLDSLSFQLSFTAMAGVIVGLPVISTLTAAVSASASDWWITRWGRYVLTLLIASVVISTTTTLATLPLVAWHFGEIPLMSVPATILAMPAMPAALMGTAATAVAGLFASQLAVVPGTLAWAPLAWLIWVADAMPPVLLRAPWLTAHVVAGWMGITGLLAVLASSRTVRLAVAGLRGRRRWRPTGSAGLVAAIPVAVIAALLLVGQFTDAKADGLLHVYVLDVGQGDAILVVTPEGRRMLVDGGPDPKATLGAIARLMPPGDRSLDLVAATHLDSDHVGGLLGVLDRYRAGTVLHGGAGQTGSALFPQWRAVLRDRDHPVAAVHAGHRIRLGRDVTVEALHPPANGLPAGVERNANNESLALRLDYGDVSFLLTGDIEVEAERYLVEAAGDRLQADVLKVGHHGSRTSTTQAFLDRVNPRSAVISAGRENRFGHPHADVVERLETSVGAERVFLTARDGTVEYVSDGEALWVEVHGATSEENDSVTQRTCRQYPSCARTSGVRRLFGNPWIGRGVWPAGFHRRPRGECSWRRRSADRPCRRRGWFC